jgi:hypothetical protein
MLICILLQEQLKETFNQLQDLPEAGQPCDVGVTLLKD